MSKKKSIAEIEKQIEFCELVLFGPIKMTTWAEYIAKYNALKIELCHARGERPSAGYGKTDYII